MFSLIIPIYKNEESLSALLSELASQMGPLEGKLELVFVVDGSPDRSAEILREELPKQNFPSKLILLSRNFGSFAAIRAGMRSAEGDYVAVVAADLQEPLSLILDFFQALEQGEADIVVGKRLSRNDPWLTRLCSNLFWNLFRAIVSKQIPAGGVDIFGCTSAVRHSLLALEESNSSLIGLLYWVGYRRKEFGYHRKKRPFGKSAWTFRRKLKYLRDSIFSFSDLPIRALLNLGMLGLTIAVGLGLVVIAAKLDGRVQVPGYTITMITILFFSGLNSLGLGIVGSYVWRAFENTKHRPQEIVSLSHSFKALRASKRAAS